tara:strand:- start:844 stop:996 length:153 start_codon:yes stop_codon:yes gene_type:complete
MKKRIIKTIKENRYEVLWNLYHTLILILLAGILLVEVLEYLRYPAHFFGV